ncbi:hypothetical protein PpBr36_08147, partial [Pyricularia pennisetigena]
IRAAVTIVIQCYRPALDIANLSVLSWTREGIRKGGLDEMQIYQL